MIPTPDWRGFGAGTKIGRAVEATLPKFDEVQYADKCVQIENCHVWDIGFDRVLFEFPNRQVLAEITDTVTDANVISFTS